MKKIILFALVISSILVQAADCYTRSFSHTIQSVRLRYASEVESLVRQDPVRPYLTLPADGIIDGSDPANTLEISFDEMSHDIQSYYYTVQHLNADGTEDDLQSFEYIRGFTRSDITDYATSLNTAVNYTHYRFTFPNEDMQLMVSGNYRIIIYDANRGEQSPVASVFFRVVEPLVTIHADVTANTIKEIAGKYQQVDIDVNTSSIPLTSPNQVKLVVQQNGRIDNMVVNPYPSYIEANKLRWKDHHKLVFEGGNEYRHLDIWSTYFAGNNVDKIRHDGQDYHAFLFPDKRSSSYMHEYDHNGMFTIHAERCNDIDTEAEYMYVHWLLPMAPIMEPIYIGGDVFGNQIVPTLNRMLYDEQAGCYYYTALLKQGGYDYQYWIKKKNEPSATLLMTEGSYWQTENVYDIYVYFRSVSDRYDRLVGYYSSSSI